MEKIRISSKNKFINDVIALYETAFPQNERRETDELIRLIDNCPEFHFNVFADGEQFIGFFSTWEWPDFRYGEHFAVCPSHRGGGIGTQILKSIADADNRPMIIEVEPPFDDIARRRIEFYRRNGFRLWDSIHYVQPPYA